MTRIESASSVNTFNSCQRKYFYHYKLELPGKESLAALNGKAVHTALEHFFTLNPTTLTFTDYENQLRNHLLNAFNKAWIDLVPTFASLEEDKTTIKDVYHQSLVMLENFSTAFLHQLNFELKTKPLLEAFSALKPQTEVCLTSDPHHLRGFIDAIHIRNGMVTILDYKTTKSDELTEEYKLQLAIYALLFKEHHGRKPDKVGLYFLRHGSQKMLDVDDALLEHAEKTCSYVHSHTASNNIEDYPKNLGTWCRWCDYKDLCFGQKTLQDYQSVKEDNT